MTEEDCEGETCLFPALFQPLISSFFLSVQTMAHMKVIAFQGKRKADSEPAPPMTLQPVKNLDLTPSPDVPLAILKRKMMASNDIRVARGLLMEISSHLKVKSDKALWCFGSLQNVACLRPSMDDCSSVPCKSDSSW